MSEVNTVDALTEVLSSVQQNRLQLTKQLEQLDQQKEVGVKQIQIFDTLIATLQVSLTENNTLALVDAQLKANDHAPLKAPSQPAGGVVEGTASGDAANGAVGATPASIESGNENTPA